eukprot:2523575-Rhodomonas_salina.1
MAKQPAMKPPLWLLLVFLSCVTQTDSHCAFTWTAVDPGCHTVASAGSQVSRGSGEQIIVQLEFQVNHDRVQAKPWTSQIPRIDTRRQPFGVANVGHHCSRRAFLRRSLPVIAAPILVPEISSAVGSESAPKTQKKFETRTSGLQLQDVVVGGGKEVVPGSKVTFHYIGRLAGRQGKPFEDTYRPPSRTRPYISWEHTEPFVNCMAGPGAATELITFPAVGPMLTRARLQEEGLIGMREGSKRRLLIPSTIGYNDKYVPVNPRVVCVRCFAVLIQLRQPLPYFLDQCSVLHNSLHLLLLTLSFRTSPGQSVLFHAASVGMSSLMLGRSSCLLSN